MDNFSYKQHEAEDIRNEKYSYNPSREFKCEICDFKVPQEITESVTYFVQHLGLEDFSEEYENHFKRYDTTVEERHHVEKMVKSQGPEWIL